MKEKVFNAILSIATVVLGGLIVLAETSLLAHHGVESDVAFLVSLYSGFMGWIILAAVLTTTDWFYDHVTNKIIKK
jgi:hypothetical protein